jgi:hypothetical protein
MNAAMPTITTPPMDHFTFLLISSSMPNAGDGRRRSRASRSPVEFVDRRDAIAFSTLVVRAGLHDIDERVRADTEALLRRSRASRAAAEFSVWICTAS